MSLKQLQKEPNNEQSKVIIPNLIEAVGISSIPFVDSSPSKKESIEQKEHSKQIKHFDNKEQKIISQADHQQKHISTGQYLKSGVYGGLDGLINCLSIILGGVAVGADTDHILLIALAGLFGDGIAMGLGDYLSSKSEIQYIKAERQRQTWEAENKLDDQLKEMEELYVEKGYSLEDSKQLGKLISKNSEAFVNIMMLEELGLTDFDGSPIINGIVNFSCFIVFGFLPVLPYCINKATHSKSSHILISSIVIGGFFLFFLGLLKAWFIGTNPIKSGLMTLILGSAAVAIGYGIGVAIQ